MTRPQPRYRPGDRIGGRYQVHKALMGGMGEVYLCLDLEENYPFALKTFQQRYQSTALRTAFEQEVGTWVALEKHPNIVRCFYMKTLDNQPFMVLEWIAGEEGKGADLRGWLRRGPLDLQTALEITLDVVRGLSHAQEKQPGLVHRDLKPENILVAQGGLAKITDFGLAQIVESVGLEEALPLTPSLWEGEPTTTPPAVTGGRIEGGRHSLVKKGGIAGTPAYMAPEQWRGEALDERTDIYAIGCILYEMLTGQWPFQVGFSPTTPQQLQQWLSAMQAQHEHNRPATWPGDLPPAVSTVINDCLAKTPGDRPTSLAVLAARLTEVYQQHFNQPPPDRPPTTTFSADDYNNRAVTYTNLKRYEAALDDHGWAIAMDSSLAQAYSNRGNTYQAMQQYEAALIDYGRALELDPNLAQAYSNRGNTHHVMQQYEAALTDYGRALELDSSLAVAYSNQGNTYADLQQYKAALAAFGRALELDPSLAVAYSNRGVTYAKLQQYKAALADYGRALELDPSDAMAYYNRGNTYIALQQYEAALADYRWAIELDPNLALAYYNRGVTYAKLQRYEAALADYRRAIELDPSDATAYLDIGTLLGNQGHLREALPFFDQAAQLGDSTGAQYAAQTRQMLGDTASTPQVDPAQQAFEAFQQTASMTAMQQTVVSFPFMVQPYFITAIEQAIAQQVPPEHRPHFEQRLAWLKQIAQEENQ